MMRRSTWEADLSAYLATMADAVFEYGEVDCALFAAGAVRAMTGEDPARAFRDKYNSMKTSLSALRKYGRGTLVDTIDDLFPEKPVAFASRGDLVFYDGSVGVCIGPVALFIGEEVGKPGLVRVPRRDWLKAWAV